jgi:hypothetical protein
MLEQIEILERIAVDHQEIGAGGGNELAECIGHFLAGPPPTLEDAGVDKGRRTEDVYVVTSLKTCVLFRCV